MFSMPFFLDNQLIRHLEKLLLSLIPQFKHFLTLLILDVTFCFLGYYYNYGFHTIFPLYLYTLLVLFINSWYAYSEAF